MSVSQKYFEGVRPIQTYLAENLDVAWLEEQRDHLERRLATNDSDQVATQFQYACNSLELGVKQGSHEYVDEAFDGLETLVSESSRDVTQRVVFQSRALLIAKDAFQVRTDRKKLFPRVMADIHGRAMDLLEEVSSTAFPPEGSQSRAMAELISFGAISRLQRNKFFPYFSTTRESDEAPLAANHEWYALSPQYPQDQKKAVSLDGSPDSPFKVDALKHSNNALLSQPARCREFGLPLQGPNTRQARLHVVANLLIAEARRDATLTEADELILQKLSKNFTLAIHHDTKKKRAAAKAPAKTEALRPPESLGNTQLADQLRNKFGSPDEY